MDSPDSDQDRLPDEGIDSLIQEYLERRQSGEELTPEQFANDHPDLSDELLPYLKGLSLLDRILPAGGDAAGVAGPGDSSAELLAIAGYQLLEEIGRGGMGVVYKALQTSTKRVVALKVMLVGPFASQSALRRFDREVQLAARLQHPGIVRVLDSGQVAGQKYYAMDYVEGVRLDSHAAGGQLDVRATLDVLRRVCEAVEYAHHHGVIHRDLKPANVLVDEEGNPHILDFGLAKATDQPETQEALSTCVSVPGQVMGTLFYLSPEQAAGTPDEIDARTDVYALGVMLFEALTGSLPFDTTGRPSQVIQRILESPPISPSSVSKWVDSELETIILKALEKDKSRRYQSAGDMAEDIRRYLEGEPILARRPSSFYFLRKKVLKHRWAAALGTMAVALSLIALWTGIRWRQQDLVKARWEALEIQRILESGSAGPAVGRAEALYRRYPQLPEAPLVAAHTLHRDEGTPATGLVNLERVLQRDPSRWPCRALLAEIHRAAGNVQEADALQARAEREAPDTAEAWYLRSFATLDLQRAYHCAREAVTRFAGGRSQVLAWVRFTRLCLQTGDLDGGLQGADKLIELGQDAAEWTFFKGKILAMHGRLRQAIEQYTRVTRLQSHRRDHPLGPAYIYRAQAYRRLEEYAKALADYNKVIELAGETGVHPWLFYQRATPLWILGRRDQAVEDYKRFRSVRGRPFYSDARQFLILREQGRRRKAEQVLADALGEVKDPWLRRIFQCLTGQLTPEELVAAALAEDNREHLCEAYYYAGEVCLLSDKLAAAREWFQQCVQTGLEFDPDTAMLTPMNEYELAHWRLDTLFAGVPASLPEKN